jgi:hypothetical protein
VKSAGGLLSIVRLELLLRSRALALLVALAGASPAAAADLEAFASVEAGSAGGCVFAPVFLPGGNPYSGVYGIPTNSTFQGCGFSADSGVQDVKQATGPVSATWTASDAQFSGAAQASASYGSVGASASGSSTRSGNSLGDAAGAYGVFADALTVTSPSHANGTAGLVAFEFDVDGQVAVTNGAFDPGFAQLLGHADAFLALSVDGRLANVLRGDVTLEGSETPSIEPALAGFLSTQGPTGWSFAGADSVSSASFPLPMTFGTPFALTVGLLAEAYPQTESASVGTASVDFLTTAKLTRVFVYDSLDRPIYDFQLTSESGMVYAPEPPGATLAITAWLVLALRARVGPRRSRGQCLARGVPRSGGSRS